MICFDQNPFCTNGFLLFVLPPSCWDVIPHFHVLDKYSSPRLFADEHAQPYRKKGQAESIENVSEGRNKNTFQSSLALASSQKIIHTEK